MRSRVLKPLALAALCSATAATAAPTTIDFDGAVSADITSAYAGLTFRAGDPLTGPVRTWAAAPLAADTGSNVIGLAAGYGLNQVEATAIDILFDTAVSFVSIRASFAALSDFGFSFGGTPFLAAYSSTTFSAATRLGMDTWDIPGDPCLSGNFCQSGWDTLSWTSAAADILGVRITASAPTGNDSIRRGIFDTLTYDVGGGGGGGGGTVPVPTSLALAGLALVLLAHSSRQASRSHRRSSGHGHHADAGPTVARG